MSTEVWLPFTVHFGEARNCQLKEILYEFIANAIDASAAASAAVPEVNISPDRKEISVVDKGSGLVEENFTVLGPSVSSSTCTNRLGAHGIGLKDVIPACLRLDITVRIESIESRFTFSTEGGEARVKMSITSIPPRIGTCVFLRLDEGFNRSEFSVALNQFLLFSGIKTRQIRMHSSDKVHFFSKTNRAEKAQIFLQGVMKKGLKEFRKNLKYHVNIVCVTPELKRCVSRDQAFIGPADQILRSLIESAYAEALGDPILLLFSFSFTFFIFCPFPVFFCRFSCPCPCTSTFTSSHPPLSSSSSSCPSLALRNGFCDMGCLLASVPELSATKLLRMDHVLKRKRQYEKCTNRG